MIGIIKWFIKSLKTYQDYETSISILKSVTGKAKLRKVGITDDQMDILIVCGILGIKDGNQIEDITGIKIPEPEQLN